MDDARTSARPDASRSRALHSLTNPFLSSHESSCKDQVWIMPMAHLYQDLKVPVTQRVRLCKSGYRIGNRVRFLKLHSIAKQTIF